MQVRIDETSQLPDSLPIPRAVRPLRGQVRLPGSKSLTNRALVLAALARGRSVLRGASVGEDSRRMAEALRRLGARIDDPLGDGTVLVVEGTGGELGLRRSRKALDAGEAGTTARFLLPLLVMARGRWILDGGARLRRRPMAELAAALRRLGARIEGPAKGSRLPLAVEGRKRSWGGEVPVDARRSSQFASALLMAGPCLERGIALRLLGDEVASRPYLVMTTRLMGFFGAPVESTRWGWPAVPGGGGYQGRDLAIEGDASGASCLFAAAAIAGGRIRCTNLDSRRSLQGDACMAELLGRMGCGVRRGPGWVEVEKGTGPLRPLVADLNATPDLVPALAVTALFARGTTRLLHLGHLRLKESDRLAVLARELRRLGGRAEAGADELVIEGRGGEGLHGAMLETCGDHRMAMSLALAGLRVEEVSVRDPACCAKSFPGYFEELFRLLG